MIYWINWGDHMEQIKMDIKLDQQAIDEKENWIKECSEDPHVQEFLIKNHCKELLLEKTSMFYKWSLRKKICAECKGLSECRQPMNGKILDLKYDGYLTEVMHSCDYSKQKQAEDAYLKNMKYHHLSDEQLRLNFHQIDRKNEYEETIKTMAQLIKSIDTKTGIYLYGKPGVGKTYLMCCLANAYMKKNHSVAFVNSAQLISELKLGFNEGNMNDSIINTLKKVDVLFIDDIGGENVTAWSRDEILMPLLNERMERQALTYFTSNYNFEELEEHFAYDSRGMKDLIKANRLMERIKALSIEEILKGNNRRLKKL